MDINKLVNSYIILRDRKAAMKAEFDNKVADVDKMLDKVEGVLLKHFIDTGAESVRTDAGTAYKTVKTSCTAADKNVFFNFLQESGEWGLADIRPAKVAVVEYKTANGELPPGLNFSEEVAVNIRRGK